MNNKKKNAGIYVYNNHTLVECEQLCCPSGMIKLYIHINVDNKIIISIDGTF